MNETLADKLDMADTYLNAIREKIDAGKMEEWQAEKLLACLTVLEFTFDSLDA